MAEVLVHATGQRITADGSLLDYYRGEAVTVGGYSIDGVAYPARVGEDVEQLPEGGSLDLSGPQIEHPGYDGTLVGVEHPADGTEAEVSSDPDDDHPSPKPH